MKQAVVSRVQRSSPCEPKPVAPSAALKYAVGQFLIKSCMHLPYDPAIPLLVLPESKESIHSQEIYLYTNPPSNFICNNRKSKTTRMSINKRMDKPWSLHTMEPAIKRNELRIQATTQTKLKKYADQKKFATKVYMLGGSVYVNF